MRNTEGVQIPAELLNNVAVLNQIQLDASRKDPAAMDTIQVLYAEALRNIERAAEASGDMTEDMEANRLTIQFNIAVFYEESGQKVKAENMYLDLVKKYPAYTDCMVFILKARIMTC